MHCCNPSRPVSSQSESKVLCTPNAVGAKVNPKNVQIVCALCMDESNCLSCWPMCAPAGLMVKKSKLTDGWFPIRAISNGCKSHSCMNFLIFLLIWHSFCSQRPFSHEVVLANCDWNDPKKVGHDPKKSGSSVTHCGERITEKVKVLAMNPCTGHIYLLRMLFQLM